MRIGVHTGPALEKGGDLFGRNVALAARVADQARGGEILVTAEVGEVAADAGELAFTDPREVELKGLPGRYTLIPVGWQETLESVFRRSRQPRPSRRKSVWMTLEDAVVSELDHLAQHLHLKRDTRVAGGSPGARPDQHDPALAQPQLLDHRVPVGEDLVDVAHQRLHPDVAAVLVGLAEGGAGRTHLPLALGVIQLCGGNGVAAAEGRVRLVAELSAPIAHTWASRAAPTPAVQPILILVWALARNR